MAEHPFLKSLTDDIRRHELCEPGSRVLVAVSGGPDSMALLHGLVQVSASADLRLDLHVGHLNHCLRGADAEADAAFVHAAADSLGLPCHIVQRDVAKIAEQRNGTLVETARAERYRVLERICMSIGSELVAVGHHADDNAETVLHRILRGTGLRGLGGIPMRRSIGPLSDVWIIRPMLHQAKRDVLSFLNEAGIPFREDRSNASNDYMRNKIRNVLLPTLREQVNPQVSDALLRLAEQARWFSQYLDETAQRMFETLIISHTDQELSLNALVLARKNPIVQTELVRRAIESFEIGQQELSFVHLTSVLDLLGDGCSGKEIHLPGGLVVARRYDRLVLSRSGARTRETFASEVAVQVPGVTHLLLRRMEIACEMIDATPEETEHWRRNGDEPWQWLDWSRVHPPLVIRSRRKGDRFWPLGAPGSKKVSEFLIDAKVDPAERDHVALVCDQLGPIWIVGHRIDDRVRIGKRTRRVLKIQARPLSDPDDPSD